MIKQILEQLPTNLGIIRIEITTEKGKVKVVRNEILRSFGIADISEPPLEGLEKGQEIDYCNIDGMSGITLDNNISVHWKEKLD